MNLIRMIFALIALLALWPSTRIQAQATASLAGRLTLNDRGVPNIEVGLQRLSADGNTQPTAPLNVMTDEEGRYRLTGLAPGRYSVAPLNSAYVMRGGSGPLSKTITLKEGEALDNVDFALARGGVITGKVTNADNQPVIGERVEIILLDEQGRKRPTPSISYSMSETDDRGVYRLYGLPAGRYLVSVGLNTEVPTMRVGFGGTIYRRTFHPNVTEEAKATKVEVSEGGEASNIDIRLGRPTRSFNVTARIINAETGQPVPGMRYGHSSVQADGRSLGGFGRFELRSDAQGEFRIDGLLPGRYVVYAAPDIQQNLYSENTSFEITDNDVADLQIMLRRGGTIAGTVALEGNPDPDLFSQITKFTVRTVSTVRDTTSSPLGNAAQINPDGSFLITGLQPGKVRITVSPLQGVKGFSLARVEREGADQREGIEVGPSENVTGVRLVVAYGNGVIRGQVKIEGGTLPEGAGIQIVAYRLTPTGPMPGAVGGSTPDINRNFLFESLAIGDYELRLTVYPPYVPGDTSRTPIAEIKQKVTVSSGAETPVTITLNLAAKDQENKQ